MGGAYTVGTGVVDRDKLLALCRSLLEEQPGWGKASFRDCFCSWKWLTKAKLLNFFVFILTRSEIGNFYKYLWKF